MESTDVSEVPADLPVADGSLEDLFLGSAVSRPAEFADEIDNNELSKESLDLKELEDVAHQARALISSDGLRFINDRVEPDKQVDLLRALIARGRSSFPQEDGWLIINLDRIQQLYDGNLAEVAIKEVEPVSDVKPTGSLAEAILAGQVSAAYALIDHRPMVSLAAAAADLDSLYRLRNGQEGVETAASELLKQEVMSVSTETLERVIKALTSALDGTYKDERSAVKMAILKAIQALETN